MKVMKWIFNLIMRILLIPVWMLLAMAWIMASAVVHIGCIAKGIISFLLGIVFITTVIWFRTDWFRYLLMGIVEAMLLSMFIAGSMLEAVLCIMRQRIGDVIVYGN